MFLQIALIIAVVCSSQGFPRPEEAPSRTVEPKPILYVPERQQYRPDLHQYDLALLEPQFQIPGYSFIGDKQHFPSIQPQIIVYRGAAPGQPFLLQPGSPPGNFLVPQGGPNVILENPPQTPPSPQTPLFVAGYPKPAHIPPIEKDAEEIPTNPSKIPPLRPEGENKPEKLETFNEDDGPNKSASEADVLAAADRNPAFNPKPSLRPGQRFFILNGQPLFSNFPYNNQIYPSFNPNFQLKYSSFIPQAAIKQTPPFQNFFLKSDPLSDIAARQQVNKAEFQQSFPENLVLLNQPGTFQDSIFKSPLSSDVQQSKEGKVEQINPETRNFENLPLRETSDQSNDAIIIVADDQQDEPESNTSESNSEDVSAAEKPSEPTISQAQPGAIALAGPGGVAAAAPRGTAFVGKEGVAVSSPQATAVAGPSRSEAGEDKNKKQNKKKQ